MPEQGRLHAAIQAEGFLNGVTTLEEAILTRSHRKRKRMYEEWLEHAEREVEGAALALTPAERES